jgi:hypothetical protein
MVSFKYVDLKTQKNQCCGVECRGAKIKLPPGAAAKIKKFGSGPAQVPFYLSKIWRNFKEKIMLQENLRKFLTILIILG